MAVRRPVAKTSAKTPVEKPVVEAAPAPAPAVAAPAVVAPAAEAKAPASDPMSVNVADLQANLRSAAVKSIEQGRAAFDRLKAATDEAAHTLEDSVQATSKDAVEIATKALDTFKLNANAAFDHMKALAGAKNMADAIAIHGQYIRTHSETAVAQAKEFAELAKKAASNATARLQEQVKKPIFPAS